MEIFRAPPILILQLKRFKTKDSGYLSGGGRLNTLVDFPLTGLDLAKYVKDTKVAPIYDLCAVSNHYGNLGFGHYTAFAYNEQMKGWYRFDDSSASRASESEICSTASYVLFYKRRDIVEPIDYSRLKQCLPAGYAIPTVPSKPVQKEEKKPALNEEEKGPRADLVPANTIANANRNVQSNRNVSNNVNGKASVTLRVKPPRIVPPDAEMPAAGGTVANTEPEPMQDQDKPSTDALEQDNGKDKDKDKDKDFILGPIN
jgi:hypothetical protein